MLFLLNNGADVHTYDLNGRIASEVPPCPEQGEIGQLLSQKSAPRNKRDIVSEFDLLIRLGDDCSACLVR